MNMHAIVNRICELVQNVEGQIFVISFLVVTLFNGISTLCRLFNAKAILLEEQ